MTWKSPRKPRKKKFGFERISLLVDSIYYFLIKEKERTFFVSPNEMDPCCLSTTQHTYMGNSNKATERDMGQYKVMSSKTNPIFS